MKSLLYSAKNGCFRRASHLAVLRAVRLVTVRSEGQQRFYRLDGAGLKPVHDWVKGFEQFWNERFDRLAGYLGELQGRKPKR